MACILSPVIFNIITNYLCKPIALDITRTRIKTTEEQIILSNFVFLLFRIWPALVYCDSSQFHYLCPFATILSTEFQEISHKLLLNWPQIEKDLKFGLMIFVAFSCFVTAISFIGGKTSSSNLQKKNLCPWTIYKKNNWRTFFFAFWFEMIRKIITPYVCWIHVSCMSDHTVLFIFMFIRHVRHCIFVYM